MFFIPREALDIDYCDTTPAMLIDEFNYLGLADGDLSYAWGFEQIMAMETMIGIQDKVGFRHDPIMFHQVFIYYYVFICNFIYIRSYFCCVCVFFVYLCNFFRLML